MRKITILTDCSDTTFTSKDAIGMLVECAADSQFRMRNKNAIPREILLSDIEDTRRLACIVAEKLLTDEPCFRGIAQLTIFKEFISSELEKAFHIIQLHDYLLAEEYQACEFVKPSWWGDSLNKLVRLRESSLQVKAPAVPSQNKIIKSINRIASNGLSYDSIYTEFHRCINHIDPFHRRSLLFKLTKQNIPKHRPWFYTTAVNFTNIGLIYEPYFSEPFHYLVEDKLTGGKPLQKNQRLFSSLYSFSHQKYIPKADEIEHATQAITKHVLRSSLAPNELLACQLFLNGRWANTFFQNLLPSGLYSSTICENWLDETAPSHVIVGNQVFEGYALLKARSRKIPTTLLQHGVLADYFPYSDYPVDRYVVRGQFFYERLSSASQKRAIICNPAARVIQQKSYQVHKNHIVYVSQPLNDAPSSLGLGIDLDSILLVMLQKALELSAELVIRVHPLETISDYKSKIENLQKQCSSNIKVNYSSGSGLDELLAKASVVVMFASTVFLDCIRNAVPIISFEWFDFGFKQQLKLNQIFHFAKDLENLGELLTQAQLGQLPPPKDNIEYFLANMSADEIQSCIKQLH